jgi:glucose dehydrogenase
MRVNPGSLPCAGENWSKLDWISGGSAMRVWKAGGFVLFVCLTVAASGQPGAKDGEWPTYGADLHNSRYRPATISAIQLDKGEILGAYDKATGKEVGAVWMPAPQTGSPMTYMAKGKQYIIVAVSGGPYLGEYPAFTLPAEEK